MTAKAELDIEYCIEQYNSGATTVELAKKYNCHCTTIRNRLVANGVEIRKSTDLIGRKWNHLTLKSFCDRDRWGAQFCLFECDCPEKTRKEILLSSVKNGKTKSCGCLHLKSAIINGKNNSIHGLSESKLYNVWRSIKSRCLNNKDKGYKNYGKRGIAICDEWKGNFQAFYDWAMENGYKEGLTIDRIDNDGNYEPKNCKWTTQKEQMSHTRNSHMITFNNKTQCLKLWSEELKIDYGVLSARFQDGWTIEEAFGHNNMKILGLDNKEYTLKLSTRQRGNASDGHLIARNILKEIFPLEKIFEETPIPGCSKGNLYFDFIIPSKKIVIEVQGIQHEKYIKYFHKDKKGFNNSKNRDKLKSDWTKLNNFTLIELLDGETEDEWRRKIESRGEIISDNTDS